MKANYFLLFFSVLISLRMHAQKNDCGANAGFELGNTTGWVCKYGTYGGACPAVSGACAQFQYALNSTGQLNPFGLNAPLNNFNDRHTIVTAAFNGNGLDPNSLGNVSVVPSIGGLYVFRLGNAAGHPDTTSATAQAESIRMSFIVDYQNTVFTYRYAAFLQDGGHTTAQKPRFEVWLYDQNNDPLPCGNYKIVAGDTACRGLLNLTTGAGAGSNQWYYSDWTTFGVDLSAYVGQTVSIEFRTSDCLDSGCTAGRHSAYAYIDCFCEPLITYSNPFDICQDKPTTICGMPGFPGVYWPGGQPGIPDTVFDRCVTIQSPVPGTVYTMNYVSFTGCPGFTKVGLFGWRLDTQDTVLCEQTGTMTLNASITNFNSLAFSWSFNWTGPGGFSSTDQNPVIPIPAATSVYTVTVTSDNGCTVVRNVTVTIYPQPCAIGIEDRDDNPVFVIYPNPGSGLFIVSHDATYRDAKLEVFNPLGEKIFFNAGLSGEMDLRPAAVGMYYYRITTGDGRFFTGKLIKD